MIQIQFEDTEILELNPEFFVSWLTKVCVDEEKELGEVSLVFCSDDYLLEKNKQFLNHDYYTDIITFDYVEGNVISGDLLISTDRVLDNALEREIDFRTELNRVIVHGVLHLIGYKDKSLEEEMMMRQKEDHYLSFT